MNMRVEVIWAIRDARNLTAAEKAFLFVVESRGSMSSKWTTAAADMGLKKDAYYGARASLLEKGYLKPQRRMDKTTVYVVDADSVTANACSATQNDYSVTQNEDSGEPETKVTIKATRKETMKETKTMNPYGFILTTSLPKTREEAKPAPVYFLDLNTTAAPSTLSSEDEREAHSVTQNEDEIPEEVIAARRAAAMSWR